MGKKFMPKLFKKKTSGEDGSSGSAANADMNASGASDTPVSSSEPIKSSVTASAHSEEGGEPKAASSSSAQGPSFSYRPAGKNRTEASNGDHSPPQLNRGGRDAPEEPSSNTAKANSNDSNGSNGSVKSNSKGTPHSPIMVPTNKPEVLRHTSSCNLNMELDSADADRSYEQVPLLDIIELPRGGVSIETSAVGPVQFGIPPETIKDSMNLGLDPPSVYIVPVDRFCRDMGPALGVNLAEFEFPAYFNFFVRGKRCTLIVDSVDAERNIRKVFNETLLGPAQFRQEDAPLSHAEEDFAPEFPKEAIPNFYRELKHFRIMPNGEELVLETLLKFCHFETAPDMNFRDNLGAPPKKRRGENEDDEKEGEDDGGEEGEEEDDDGVNEGDDNNEDERDSGKIVKKSQKSLTYSQIRWIGDVTKIYPDGSSEEDIAKNKCKRVEVFKMPSGTDYVIHDIDENNIIVGKARFSGHVRVSEGISVIGLDSYDDKGSESEMESISPAIVPPTFHPPSFGVTVLGNSHGFDKSGSTSGYVLWINGRGVMIDPPPYSSATLEREGIRPRTIVGIILTHCHADHDAGAFQKVLTGSPVVVITTPTIYKSFIRKYAALSSLSPALLRHSHRYKPAIIGEPLRFQGATFHFTYTLHSIPCVGFRVEWRGRSMVFTGDHFNNPPALSKLVEKGVLSQLREADLNHLPLQETDLLLHEAGAPPIHTPLDVLYGLPKEVKNRLYVVHTSALPEGCELRAAPTGTAGTIRLDRIRRSSSISTHKKRPSIFEPQSHSGAFTMSDGPLLEDISEYAESELFTKTSHHYSHLLPEGARAAAKSSEPPPVSLRPTSSTDAWFILNLLSAVPFLSSLSYTSTMELLETTRVDAVCCNEVVLSAKKRSNYLVVVWEGTCMERDASGRRSSQEDETKRGKLAVWHAGDWTGPRILQPEKRLSGDSPTSTTHDVVAMSAEGVKVIMVDFASLHRILSTGSALYQKYHSSLSQTHTCTIPDTIQGKMRSVFESAVENLNIIELLDSNTGLRKLTAVQKRHLECLVEGPTVYAPGQRLWRSGSPVDKAFIVVAGTVSFVPKRRHGGSCATGNKAAMSRVKRETAAETDTSDSQIGEQMRESAVRAVRELHAKRVSIHDDEKSFPDSDPDEGSLNESHTSTVDNPLLNSEAYEKLTAGLKKWAERNERGGMEHKRKGSESSGGSPEVSLHDYIDVSTVQDVEKRTDSLIQQETTVKTISKKDSMGEVTDVNVMVSRPTKDRFANKVLGRLYNRRAFASGLVFSRGHFLGDIEKMVEGLLSSANNGEENNEAILFDFDDTDTVTSRETLTIFEVEGGKHTAHTSTLAAGKDGCLVMVLPKSSLIPFLDQYPGLLLSLLGTQVVV